MRSFPTSLLTPQFLPQTFSNIAGSSKAGPRSRKLLSKITDTDLSNEHFPWLAGKEIEVAGVILRALRINYVGELGWELHMPITQLISVYNSVFAAGKEFSIVDFGMYALSSLGSGIDQRDSHDRGRYGTLCGLR